MMKAKKYAVMYEFVGNMAMAMKMFNRRSDAEEFAEENGGIIEELF